MVGPDSPSVGVPTVNAALNVRLSCMAAILTLQSHLALGGIVR